MSKIFFDNQQTLPLCATAASAVMPSVMTCKGKSQSCEVGIQKQKSSKTLAGASTGSGKACSPYWNADTAERSCALWLPTKTGLHDSALHVLKGWQSKTGARSWFKTEQITVHSKNSPKIFCPSSIRSLVASRDCESTVLKSRKIRISLTRQQKATVKVWCDGSRWCYNKAVELYRGGATAGWQSLWSVVAKDLPERFGCVPYKVKKGAVSDAYKAYVAVKKRVKNGEAAELHFRSRKNPIQSVYLCHDAWTKDLTTIYPRSVGALHLSEPLSVVPRDGRLVCHNGRYYVTVPYSSPRRVAETQGRVVALDPGLRSFLTFYAEDGCGKIGEGDFGRIQRLCAHLDTLLSRVSKAYGFRKVRLNRAVKRMRWKMRDLIDELHKQVSRWLVDHYDVILLPTFQTQDMVLRGKRRLRKKSVRSMLTFAHYRFKQFLKHKAFACGKLVLDVNEAYTSKTVSWTGEIIKNLGGAKVVKSGIDGQEMDRDINGARGIFLRALGDTPKLRGCLA